MTLQHASSSVMIYYLLSRLCAARLKVEILLLQLKFTLADEANTSCIRSLSLMIRTRYHPVTVYVIDYEL